MAVAVAVCVGGGVSISLRSLSCWSIHPSIHPSWSVVSVVAVVAVVSVVSVVSVVVCCRATHTHDRAESQPLMPFTCRCRYCQRSHSLARSLVRLHARSLKWDGPADVADCHIVDVLAKTRYQSFFPMHLVVSRSVCNVGCWRQSTAGKFDRAYFAFARGFLRFCCVFVARLVRAIGDPFPCFPDFCFCWRGSCPPSVVLFV